MNQAGVAPIFDLKKHHLKIKVPTEFSLEDLAEKYSIFPLKVIVLKGKRRLLLAMRNIHDSMAILDVEFRSGLKVIAVQAEEVDIHWLIETYYYGHRVNLDRKLIEPELTRDLFSQFEMITKPHRRPIQTKEGIKIFAIE